MNFRLLKAFAACFVLLQGSAALALDENKADIQFEKYDKNINIVVNPGGSGGCPGGQYWDIGSGGCTSAVALRTVNTSQSCGCSCPGGMSGSCSASQSGTYTVFGWRLPTSGTEKISYNGPTSWGACTETSNSCVADPVAPPTGPVTSVPVGTIYKITAMICDGSDPNYWTAPADTPATIRNAIISQYRSWLGGRCPEASGYVNWVGYVNTYAYQIWGARPGVPDAATYNTAYIDKTFPAIDAGANSTGEKTLAGVAAANYHCQVAATAKYGSTAKAEYVYGSGNNCVVTVP